LKTSASITVQENRKTTQPGQPDIAAVYETDPRKAKKDTEAAPEKVKELLVLGIVFSSELLDEAMCFYSEGGRIIRFCFNIKWYLVRAPEKKVHHRASTNSFPLMLLIKVSKSPPGRSVLPIAAL